MLNTYLTVMIGIKRLNSKTKYHFSCGHTYGHTMEKEQQNRSWYVVHEDGTYEIPPPSKTKEELVYNWGLRVQAYQEHLKKFPKETE